ncbi:type VI secretion system baseplate subunit TssG [uncultured Tateyamaria sp.]|uniref:type VI secretion system baseplate subunit TssG n=1 Tax=uncultured Tateyamaria sp. TaxID=455651 RepID=UPI00262CB03E|nr:type VI secretion system baseplate subunit TssG [uncultured Tateyamaria sp.]
MASQERTAGPDLTRLAALNENPETFNFFRALRLIEAVHQDSPRLGTSRRPSEDPVRLAQAADLAFAPSTIKSFAKGENGVPTLTQLAFGLFGPNGPLPLHMTEFARDRQRNMDDPTMVAFADMFHHRMLSLLYRAWASGQPTASFDRPGDDGFGRKVGALAGFAGDALDGRDAMPDVAKKHFAGLLAASPRSEAGLTAIITQLFDTPVEVESFVGSWLHLEPCDRGQLGSAALGGGASLGEKTWSRSASFLLRIGPMSLAEYQRLFPGTPGFKRLAAIVRTYVGDTLEWTANLILRAEEVPPAVLGQAATLGRTSWIGQRQARDADELTLSQPCQHPL